MDAINRRDYLFSPSGAQIVAYIGRKNSEGIYPTLNNVAADVSMVKRTAWGVIGSMRHLGLLRDRRERHVGRESTYELTDTGEEWAQHYRPLAESDVLLNQGQVDMLLHISEQTPAGGTYIGEAYESIGVTDRTAWTIANNLRDSGLIQGKRRGRKIYYQTTHDGEEIVKHYKALRELAKEAAQNTNGFFR